MDAGLIKQTQFYANGAKIAGDLGDQANIVFTYHIQGGFEVALAEIQFSLSSQRSCELPVCFGKMVVRSAHSFEEIQSGFSGLHRELQVTQTPVGCAFSNPGLPDDLPNAAGIAVSVGN